MSLVNTGPTGIFQKLLKRASNQKNLKNLKKKKKRKRKRNRNANVNANANTQENQPLIQKVTKIFVDQAIFAVAARFPSFFQPSELGLLYGDTWRTCQ